MENNLKSNFETILMPLDDIQSGLNSLKEIINKNGSKFSQKIIKNFNRLSIF